MKSTHLTIGNIPLRPNRFGPESLEKLTDAASKSMVRKGKKASQEALKNWEEHKTLSLEDFEALDTYASASEARYKELKSEWWNLFKAKETGAPLRDVEEKMAREGNFLTPHTKLMTELRESTARSAVEAMSGTVLGPAGVIAAYTAYSNGPTWSGTAERTTQELVTSVKELQTGKAAMTSHHNEVKAVHREELWKTMNNTLDQAIENGKAGKPEELDLQYYELTSPEMTGKIAEAAKAGNKVRLNLDAGRLSFPSKDGDGDNYFSLDATPDKIRTILQLAMVPDADIAVSLFPQKKLLNSPTDLMHRKIMRYGDQVLISGMNANIGSGENIDAGYLIKGPGARQLVDNFSRDVQDSKGATLDDIWGVDHIEKFQDTNLRLGKRGFVALFDSLGKPTPAGTILPDPQSLKELEALAKDAGADLKDLVSVPKGDYEKVMTKVAERRGEVELSKAGKKMMRALIERAIEVTNSPKNLERLDDIQLPSDKKVGLTRVDVADQPVERETIAIEAISKADKFIYLPGFVVTKAIAAAIVERHDQLKADGKNLDVRVIADSGLYPHGGTPNSGGVKHLEDHGIQPRWSMLERTNWHDRKIHAKQLITDKGEITGSTNFSNKGMTENWETSVYVHFDADDEKALKERDHVKSQFEDLWDTSYELNSFEHAAFLNRNRSVPTSEFTIDEDRDRSIRHVLRLMINFEKQSGEMFESLVAQVPDIRTQRDSFVDEGYSMGDATLMAAKNHLGPEKYRAVVESVPGAGQLRELQNELASWKSGDNVPESSESASTEVENAAPSMRVESDHYIGGMRESETAYMANFR